MPHVLIAGGPEPAQAGALLAPQTFRDGDFILALKRLFLALDGNQLVLRCVLVEPMLHQTSYFIAARHEEGLIFKVDAAISPLRTDGVKWAIAVLALELIDKAAPAHPAIRIARTNLGRQIRALWRQRGGPPPDAARHSLDTMTGE